VKSVYSGQAQRYKSVLLPIIPGYTDEFWRYETNVDAARPVLSRINRPLTLTYMEGLPADEQVAILVQDGFKKAGFDLRLEKVPRAVLSAQRRTLPFWINSQFAPAIPTPDYFFGASGGTRALLNFSGYSNPKLDTAIYESTRTERPIRDAAIKEAQRIFMTDMVVFPVAWTGQNYATSQLVRIPFTHLGVGIVNWQDFTVA
jgi:peptide/nickel transport system substrate-binding protein